VFASRNGRGAPRVIGRNGHVDGFESGRRELGTDTPRGLVVSDVDHRDPNSFGGSNARSYECEGRHGNGVLPPIIDAHRR
jgi:hypothetical protein